MRSITIRDLRLRWPAAEALLRVEKAILITRDARPVAKLVRVDSAQRPRKRFDPERHARWQRKTAGGKVSQWVDGAVTEGRRERS
jgi:antitoxin (DNA-binding transcriptional repressor) of toxin-antitoxin stability system